jgi:hypothetical protein
MTNRATRKGATASKRASKAPAKISRASTPQTAATPEVPPTPEGVTGRPSKFSPSVMETALKLYRLGHTDIEVARFLDVAEKTIYNWQKDYPAFLQAIKDAKVAWDSRVERKLAERAMGYSHEAVKIFCNKDGEITEARYTEHYPPDTVAGIFWLCNRQPDRWKQKVTHAGDTENPLVVENRESPEQRAALTSVSKRLKALESRVQK